MRRGKITKTKSTGYGYVGKWRDGTLGWFMPKHLDGYGNMKPNPEDWNIGETGYLCKITIKLMKDKLGRNITRKVR